MSLFSVIRPNGLPHCLQVEADAAHDRQHSWPQVPATGSFSAPAHTLHVSARGGRAPSSSTAANVDEVASSSLTAMGATQ